MFRLWRYQLKSMEPLLVTLLPSLPSRKAAILVARQRCQCSSAVEQRFCNTHGHLVLTEQTGQFSWTYPRSL